MQELRDERPAMSHSGPSRDLGGMCTDYCNDRDSVVTERTSMGANRSQRTNSAALIAACAAVSTCSCGIAYAQDSQPGDVLRIEVTGTNIRRADAETAVPVQVITREDIERGGSATVAELMSKLSANLLSFNDQLSIGSQIVRPFQPLPRPGQSTVNLRGIGDGSTLVLINGRRVANYAFDGGAVDVNSIPIAAIDRVEVLKDGASAIYGTDAIAGVVNFILRRDYTGAEVSAYGTATGQGGGNQYQANVTAGYGDLTRDRFNVFGTLNYQKDEALSAASRDFTRTGYRPDVGLFGGNAFSFPANIVGPIGLVNPAAASGCAPPRSLPIITDNNTLACLYDAQTLADIIPPAERFNALGRATFQLNPDLSVYTDFAYSRNRLALTLPPTPISSQFTTGGAQVLYPASGPYYPGSFAAANGIDGDLQLRFRTDSLGNRVDDIDSQAIRAVVGADGAFAGWDYDTALVYSRNTQSDDLARGYVSQQRLLQGLATGLINPFGPSGPEGDTLLQGSVLDGGNYHTATGTTWLVDGHASRDIARLPAGPLAIAVGAEARKEQLTNDFSPLAQSGDIVTIGDVASVAGDRKAQALYAEASVPFAKGWESQIAVRYDHYSDFGGTINPKLAVRWQPVSQLVLRSSWGTGFRAPTLYDLHVPVQQMGTTDPIHRDPVRCPVTHESRDCEEGFTSFGGGNVHLAPETSEQFNAGAVWEPFAGTSISIDYWKINKSNVIQTLSEQQLFDEFAHWAPTNVVRGPVDPAYPGLPGPIVSVFLGNENLGDLRTSGYDVDLQWRGHATSLGRFSFTFNGTYVTTYKLDFGTGQFSSGLGNNEVNGPVPRWRHYGSVTWSNGLWSATLAQTFQSDYSECDQLTVDPDNSLCEGTGTRHVGTYNVWDIQGQYTGFKNTKLVLGIKNLFDRPPPFTQAGGGFSGGYDPFYANPLGITYYAKLSFSFK
jgi:iron complex outermembrane receptor protein